MTMANLSSRAALRVTGADAHHFLQGLITADMEKVDATGAGYAALLTPQGKILFDFLILKVEASPESQSYILDTPREGAAALAKRLGFYKLRAKVEIADLSQNHAVVAVWGEEPVLEGIFAVDPRLASLGRRGIVTLEALAAADCADEAAWHAHRLALSVPEAGADFPYGEVFPHDVDMDHLHGVSFDKGCYVGQEVVSRMQHRGTARRRTISVNATSDLPVAGTDITAGGKTIGTLTSPAGQRGLALVRLDRAKTALDAGAPVMAGEVPVTLEIPDWAGFSWPESAKDPS